MTLSLQWSRLPAIPDHEGFAAPFAGVAGGALVVAGGANFPDKRPWEGGTKIWYDQVFVLEKDDGAWKTAGRLPRPIGYGVALTTAQGIVCIGGCDSHGHHTDVFLLTLAGGKVAATPLPPLPQPCANMCGALVGNTIYIAGGIATPDATTALKTFWALDLNDVEGGSRPPGAMSQATTDRARKSRSTWRELEPWPGRERMLATAGACDGSFFLFGGTALHAGADGKPEREYLRDAFRYTPGQGWCRIADPLRMTVAAPSPAPVVNGRLLVLGGDDGAQIHTPPPAHRGFPRGVMAYDPKTATWSAAGDMPVARVTVPCVEWRGRFVIPNGEMKPGIRSPEVWTFTPSSSH